MLVLNKLSLNRLEPYLILVVIFTTLLVNLSTFFYRSLTTPPNRVFTGAQFYTDDYAIYVANIRQGQQGYWLNRIKDHTDAFDQPSLIHEEYVLWGKLLGIFSVGPILAYHLGRAFFGLIFLLAIYYFLGKLFSQAKEVNLRVGSFLLICFGAGFIKGSGGNLSLYGSWLTELDPTQRFGALIHYSLGFTLLVILITLFGQMSTMNGSILNHKKYWFLVVFCSFLIGFVLPATFLLTAIIFSLIAFCLGLKWFLNKSIPSLSDFRFSLVFLGVFIITNIPILIYYRRLFTRTHWGAILAWEKMTQVTFNLGDYFLGLGPTIFLALFGLLVFKERGKTIFLLLCWLGAVLGGLLFLAPLINFNPTRFLQNPVYIPLAVLTTLGLEKIASLLNEKIRGKVFWGSVFLLLVISLPTNIVSLKNQYLMYADHSELIYPTLESVEAYNYLAKSTKPDEGVLTMYMAGNLIPFMAGNNVLIGHLEGMTLHASEVVMANRFFAGQLFPAEARNFLKKNFLKYVFWSPQERSMGGNLNIYPFLKPVFKSQSVTIFQVQ